ncbi:aldo keto reductase [Micractinium conductrix]|uniref:Aldo keto reductase n=1 Tax=Micractinium conductrix TaxID=554055 RepID=A0A2P6VMH0_9CHLO|nr:aldo keto reductase [Micractinium conductrix]|eukprot:PSC75257.1 aldo keto reductase [Micractinium conductrix]
MAGKLWVGGLPAGIPDGEVYSAFSKFGQLRSCWVARKPPGFGFVEFEDTRDAEDAVKELNGGRMGWKVEFARASGPKGGAGGGGAPAGGGDRGGFAGGRDAYPMKYVKLGSSDLEVSIMCLGTMTWGEQNTEEEAWEQMDLALSHGVNFLDTAELYPVPLRLETCGRTEEYIGRWMKARGNRDKIVLASKVMGGSKDGRTFVPANRTVPKGGNAPAPRLEASQIRAAVEGSLRRLQTDYIDLIQLHWPDRYAPIFGKNQYDASQHYDPVPFEEQVAAVGELIKEGKVRHWGLSNESTYGVCRHAEVAAKLGVPPPITIQNDFSMLDRRFEGQLAEACAPHHYNISLLPYGPLAGGTLTDKYFGGAEPGENARHVKFPGFQPRYHCDRSMAAAAEYADLARSTGLSLAQLALAWCKSRWYVGSTIIGATSLEQLKENISSFDLDLDQETLQAIDAIHLRIRNPNVTD